MAFHPELPLHVIAAGADMSVGSIHKTMAGLQGASVMLLKSKLVSAERFALTYDLFESTSPPVQVLASIDATRRQFALEGQAILGGLLARARRARAALAEIPGSACWGRRCWTAMPTSHLMRPRSRSTSPASASPAMRRRIG
jgi:arginine decarboxylase